MLSDKDIFVTKQARFMIVKENEGKKAVVGTIDLFDVEPQHKRAGVGIMVVEAERSKGAAGIALDLIIDYSFSFLGLHQLYCNIEETVKLIKELGGIVTIHAGEKTNSIENITHSLPHTTAQKTDIAHLIDIYELGKETDITGYKENVFPVIKKKCQI